MNQKIYLSHCWHNDDLSKTAKSLREWGVEQGFDIKADKYDAADFRPIDEFITDLTEASGTVFLLNHEFFESVWCVSELCLHYQRWGAYFHSVYLPSPDWKVDDPETVFNQLKSAVIARWPPESVPDTHRTAFENLHLLFDDLKLTKFNTDYLSNNAEQLWDVLRKMKVRDQLVEPALDFSRFDQSNRFLITHQFGNCQPLVDASGQNDAESAAKLLFDNPCPRRRLIDFFHVAELAIKNAHGEKRKRIKTAIELISISLCHYLLDCEVSFQRTTQRMTTVMNEAIGIEEEDPVVVHLVALTTVKPTVSSRVLEFDNHDLIIKEDQALHRSRIVTDSSYQQGGTYEGLLRDIWQVLNSDKALEVGQMLSEEQIIELRDTLQDQFEMRAVVYFAVSDKDKQHPLNKIANVRRLKKNLPHLVVIRTGVGGCQGLLRATISETRITNLLKSFAEL